MFHIVYDHIRLETPTQFVICLSGTHAWPSEDAAPKEIQIGNEPAGRTACLLIAMMVCGIAIRSHLVLQVKPSGNCSD
jgi:hypothetical protein